MASKFIECVSCGLRPKSNKRRKLRGNGNEDLRQYLSDTSNKTVTESDSVCNTCRQQFYFNKRKRQTNSELQTDLEIQKATDQDENKNTGSHISPKNI